MPEPWPLQHLVLGTPRLTLCPDDDAGLHELAALALRGIHPPEQMPFGHPWTDQPPDELVRGVLQYHWGARSQLTPGDWNVHLGAATARSGAYTDNPASLRVSEKLGYRPDGTYTVVRRGAQATETRLRVERDRFVRPAWTLRVAGLDGCRTVLDAARPGPPDVSGEARAVVNTEAHPVAQPS